MPPIFFLSFCNSIWNLRMLVPSCYQTYWTFFVKYILRSTQKAKKSEIKLGVNALRFVFGAFNKTFLHCNLYVLFSFIFYPFICLFYVEYIYKKNNDWGYYQKFDLSAFIDFFLNLKVLQALSIF